MNRLTLCLCGYATGLILAQYLNVPPFPLFLSSCLLLTLFLITCSPRTLLCSLCLFCVFTGFIRYPAQLSPHGVEGLDRLPGQGVLRLEGQVFSTQERPGQGLVIDMLLLSVASEPVSLEPEQRLRLYVDNAEQKPSVGSRIAFRSRVRRTRNFGTPGEFDYVRHLAYRKIWHTAYLADPRGLAIFAKSQKGFFSRIDTIRQAGLRLLDRTLVAEDAVLLKGLLLGEKGAMPAALRQKLAAGGVSHLFAISGLHLGLLSFLLYAVLKYIYSLSTRLLLWQPPVRVLWLLILPVLFFYLLLTGDALATRRAFFALFIATTLYLSRRRINPLDLLCSLAFLFLIFEPLALWQPSFLLSFSGVLGILLIQKPLNGLLSGYPRPIRYPLQLFGISIAAFIATLPVVVFMFHMLAPAGLICNLVAIPMVSFIVLPLGLAGLVMSSILPALGEPLLQISVWVLQLVVDLAGWTASMPGFISKTLFLTRLETLSLLLVCLTLLSFWRYKKALFLLIPAVCLLLFGSASNQAPELILFSVGQGESILLRVEGKTLLIDGGGLRSERFDVGERLLAPALGTLGVKSFDAIILSHNHPDHSGGLAYILDNFETREFWSPVGLMKLRPELRDSIQRNDVVFRSYDTEGWTAFSSEVLPHLSLFRVEGAIQGENNQSLCLYVPTDAGGLLLTGDLEFAGIASLLKSSMPGKVTVLKAPHHGSRNSAPARVIAQLTPEVVLVSAGYRNSYHFPSQQLLDQSKFQGVEVWRTDLDGTIRVRAVGRQWQVEHWVNGLFH